MAKHILLAYISDISGHRSAAIAIENALKLQDPTVKVRNINLFNYTNPYSEKVINHLYTSIIKKAPSVWEYLYDNPKVVRKTRLIKNIIYRFNAKKLKRLFDEFMPDVIACTQAFPCGMFANFKKTYGLNTPLIGVVTDFFAHAYWFYDNVDYYTVASDEARLRLISQGADENSIKLLGIPIAPKFAYRLKKEEIAKRIGLDLSIPAILIMGGGQGLGPITTIAKALDASHIKLQIIIVTGINTKLYKKLGKINFRKKCLLFKYVDDIDELMAVSSAIITKPGGLTISEALAEGVIPIIVKPIPGQEEYNTKYLTKNNAAIRLKNAKDVSATLEKLFSNKENFALMHKNIAAMAKPRSALDIAKLILDL